MVFSLETISVVESYEPQIFSPFICEIVLPRQFPNLTELLTKTVSFINDCEIKFGEFDALVHFEESTFTFTLKQIINHVCLDYSIKILKKDREFVVCLRNLTVSNGNGFALMDIVKHARVFFNCEPVRRQLVFSFSKMEEKEKMETEEKFSFSTREVESLLTSDEMQQIKYCLDQSTSEFLDIRQEIVSVLVDMSQKGRNREFLKQQFNSISRLFEYKDEITIRCTVSILHNLKDLFFDHKNIIISYIYFVLENTTSLVTKRLGKEILEFFGRS